LRVVRRLLRSDALWGSKSAFWGVGVIWVSALIMQVLIGCLSMIVYSRLYPQIEIHSHQSMLLQFQWLRRRVSIRLTTPGIFLPLSNVVFQLIILTTPNFSADSIIGIHFFI